MIKAIQPDNTTKITVNGLKITLNFSEDKNIGTENFVGKLLLENMFKEGSKK